MVHGTALLQLCLALTSQQYPMQSIKKEDKEVLLVSNCNKNIAKTTRRKSYVYSAQIHNTEHTTSPPGKIQCTWLSNPIHDMTKCQLHQWERSNKRSVAPLSKGVTILKHKTCKHMGNVTKLQNCLFMFSNSIKQVVVNDRATNPMSKQQDKCVQQNEPPPMETLQTHRIKQLPLQQHKSLKHIWKSLQISRSRSLPLIVHIGIPLENKLVQSPEMFSQCRMGYSINKIHSKCKTKQILRLLWVTKNAK